MLERALSAWNFSYILKAHLLIAYKEEEKEEKISWQFS